MRMYCLVICVSLLAACGNSDKGSENNTSPNNRSDMAGDTGGSDMASDFDVPDSGADMRMNNAVRDCDAITEDIITVDSLGRTGQFYSSVAFDGNGVWVAYNRPENDQVDDEAVFIARVGCDGAVDVGPLQISESASGRRNYFPAIDYHADRIHVVWVSQPTTANPKAVKYQWFEPTGVPGLSTPADVTPIGAVEDPVSETIWELDIAGYDDGAVVVATALGEDSQIVAQRFGFDGFRVDEAFFPFADKGVDQSNPTVSALPNGELYIAWTRFVPADPDAGTAEEPKRSAFVTISAGSIVPAQAMPIFTDVLSPNNELSKLAKDPGPNGELFLAYQALEPTDANINVRDLTADGARRGIFGSDNFVNFRPNIAAGTSGGAVAWFRFNQSPIDNEVMIQPFSVDPQGFFMPGTAVTVPIETKAIPPYGPGLAHLGNDRYVVSWSDGMSAPETRVKLKFYNLR